LKRLTDIQKTTIRELRASGLGYGTIARELSLSRDTVRSFCVRNMVPTETETVNPGNPFTAKTGNPSEIKIGGTVFIISTDYSETATETLEKKLEKLILNDAAKEENCCLCA